jgi:hypothetical protein
MPRDVLLERHQLKITAEGAQLRLRRPQIDVALEGAGGTHRQPGMGRIYLPGMQVKDRRTLFAQPRLFTARASKGALGALTEVDPCP